MIQRIEVYQDEMLGALKKMLANPDLSQQEFVELTERVSVVNECCEYLSDGYVLPDHLEFLLEFENPINVLANEMYHNESPNIAVPSVIWNIYGDRDYVQEYPFIPEPPPQNEPVTTQYSGKDVLVLRRELDSRLETNRADMLDSLHRNLSEPVLSHNDMVELAGEISAVATVYTHLTESRLPANEAEFLLQFQNPLEVVADRWITTLGGPHDLQRIVADINETKAPLREGYALIPETPAVEEAATKPTKKPSLLEEMRKDAANNKPAENNTAERETPEPEL